MNTDLINDLLRCYFQKCSKDPASFVSTFSTSDYIIAYHYRQREQRFTEVSRSFKTILGYSLKNVLNNDVFLSEIVHPADRPRVKEFLDNNEKSATSEDIIAGIPSAQCLKIKAHHITGYWRHLIMYGTNCIDPDSKCTDKIGLIVKEQMRQSSASLAPNNYTDSSAVPSRNKENTSGQYNLKADNISAREKEILKLISEGLITKEIANMLYISNSTVATHRKNLMNKLKVKNTAQLIKVATDRMLFLFLAS